MQLKNKFKEFFIKRPLTHAERISGAKAAGDTALILFQVAHDRLSDANDVLEATILDAQAKADELLTHARDAQIQMNMNNGVKRRLKDFIA